MFGRKRIEQKKHFMRKRRLRIGLWSALAALCFSSFCFARSAGDPGEPEELRNLYARGAVLMDGDSGRILFGKNEEEVLPMASTTKIMTCILALELSDGREICQVSEKAAAQPQVHLGMRAGETYYLEDLLYSMMLESHNDSAVCVAEHVGGSVEEFAERMNQKAAQIGCAHTHYVTPNGLDGEDAYGAHSTTASDLARVMRYCIAESEKKEVFLEITRTPEYRFQDVSGARTFSCTNHNALLSMMEGALSGKTGYTGKAGYCYIGALRRGEETFIVALLACGWSSHKNYKWSDTRRLAEYGFSHYSKKKFDLGRLEFPDVEVLHGTDKKIGVRIGTKAEKASDAFEFLVSEEEKLQAQIRLPKTVEAPVRAGTAAGIIDCSIDGWRIGEIPLVYRSSADRRDLCYCLKKAAESCLF